MGEGNTIIGPWGSVTVDAASAPVRVHAEPADGRVLFIGKRRQLIAIMLRGFLLTFLTVGIYRFWLVTQKRRFYWSNTIIDGHPLEYTGRSIQLLVGFLLAIVVFVPIYGGAFYLSTVFYEAAAFAYAGMAVILYFLAGYASYRGRRFRLTRTLWRGIRFGQSGNAWAYAIRRFLWTILTIVTLGLTYPLMVVSLYRYRYENTWFGDRKFSFSGRAGQIIGPFFSLYALTVVLALGMFWALGESGGEPSPTFLAAATCLIALPPLGIPWLRARMTSRMLSSVCVGNASLTVTVRARRFYGQYLAVALLAVLVTAVFFLSFTIAVLAWDGGLSGIVQGAALMGHGLGTLVLFAMAYLGVLAAYALIWDVILNFGFWKMVAEGAVIDNVADLRFARARHEESPVIGEGLADALNVGAY